jgi:hypothetical protein
MRGGKREGASRKRGSVARIDAEAREKALNSGETPLDFLLSAMRDENRDFRVRLDAAKAAAPYCHARLSSTELSGPSGEPLEVKTTSKLDISGLSEAELDALESALRKTSLGMEQPPEPPLQRFNSTVGGAPLKASRCNRHPITANVNKNTDTLSHRD